MPMILFIDITPAGCMRSLTNFGLAAAEGRTVLARCSYWASGLVHGDSRIAIRGQLANQNQPGDGEAFGFREHLRD